MPSRRIVLVEDTPDDEALILMGLKNAGITAEVTVLRDGQEALDFFFAQGAFKGRDTADLPWVTLLDLKLPKVDGIAVLRKLRDDPRTKLLPVVVLTSSDEERDRLKCYEMGANSFVRKPIGFDLFMRSMKELGLYWTELNQPPKGPDEMSWSR